VVPDLHDVVLRDLPVALLVAAQQHADELQREFALMAQRNPSSTEEVPARLRELVRRVRATYGQFATGPRKAVEAALEAGRQTVDVSYHLPAELAGDAKELAAALDEADAFCRRGDLLTLATPPLLVTFRRWYLGEFVRQLGGEPPQPWTGRRTPTEPDGAD
jgi:hypothetical protein